MDTEQTPPSIDSEPISTSYRATDFADFKPELADPGGTPERLAHLEEHGFVIINDFVGHPMIPGLREAGRRLTDACSTDHGYNKIDCSKGYIHRTKENEPCVLRGLIHPAFGEPGFAEFHGCPEFLDFVDSWCEGLKPEEMVMGDTLLWCNPRKEENGPAWHRDVVWWSAEEYQFGQIAQEVTPEDYSEEAERKRWEEIREKNAKSLSERNGVHMFLALADDECHELIPGSHNRWRTPFEHDVLLPQDMKDQGVPHTPSWNGKEPLPDQVAIRLKPGEALIRVGSNIHTGHTVPDRERNTVVIGWSKWSGPFTGEPSVADARGAWQLDPVVREALPYEWMKITWDRWAESRKLGDTLESRYSGYDVGRIKAGEVLGWRGELERMAAATGEPWKPHQTAV